MQMSTFCLSVSGMLCHEQTSAPSFVADVKGQPNDMSYKSDIHKKCRTQQPKNATVQHTAVLQFKLNK